MTTRAFDDPSNPELNTAGATPRAETLIGDLYRSELGRDPDAGGLAYWSNAYNTGMSLDDIRNQGFRASEEYQNLQRGTGIPETVLVNPPDVNYPIIDSGYGYLNPPEELPYDKTPEGGIKRFYTQYLGREADPEGLNSWLNAYNSGVSIDDIRQGFLNSPEYMGYMNRPREPEVVPQTSVEPQPYSTTPPLEVLSSQVIPPGFDPNMRDEYGNIIGYRDPARPITSVSPTSSTEIIPPGFNPNITDEYGNIIGYRDPARRNIPIDSRQLQSPTGEYYYPGDPRFSQIDPVRDFIQNIDQQLPYLQRAFQEQLQRFGDPVQAARAVLGSLR